MSDSQKSELQDDPQFQSILAECLEKLERGESLDREAIEARHPDYAEQLREFLDDHELLRQMATAEQDEIVLDPTIASGSGHNSFAAGESIQYIGEYRILSEIARGGMGIVFKARQRNLKRIVALKMILAGRLANEADKERFRREAQVAAGLKHPNIVPVHEIGEYKGHHYFTMDFIEGQSLAEALRDETLAPRRAAEITKTIAEAVHYAHQQGTLHRDLKPANVILDAYDKPHITDFGLAKIAADDSGESSNDLTATGQILGTPSYMSPEQASGTHALVGPASDIYSLGAVLYACLTGRAPFVADSAVDTLMQVIHDEPAPPRTLNSKLPRDLETICLKCLHKEPQRRYGSAAELGDDLGRWLSNEPIKARRVSFAEKGWLWCKRRPAVSGMGVAILLVAIVAASAIGVQHHRNERKRAESLVEAVLIARPAGVPYAIAALKPLREEAVPMLQSRCRDETLDSTERFHAACALAKFGDVRVPLLVDGIQGAPVGECVNVVTALRHAEDDAVEHLKMRFDTEADAPQLVRLATVLLHLGDTEKASAILALGPDPTRRSAFIHGLDQWHGELSDYAKPLRETDDADFRSGLCLALGRIPPNQLAVHEKQQLQSVLLDLYRTAPSGSTHSACDWALRQWNVELPQLAESAQASTNKSWHVNTLGMTMVKLPAGSFAREDNSNGKQTIALTHVFWIGNREVSFDQFQRFMEDTAAQENPVGWTISDTLVPSGTHPCNTISWYDAVLFCNWLSDQEGLTRCYERTGDKEQFSDVDNRAWRFLSDANGYRLPTDAEWEYACRAQTTTEYNFGNDVGLLDNYSVNRESKTLSCASKLPNGWGLFDMHGNLWEWCWDWFISPNGASMREPPGPPTEQRRVLRGGSFVHNANIVRSAARYYSRPGNRSNLIGFRVVRTCS